MSIEEGKKAPAFTLADKDGNKISLKDFVGKNVIVYFYPRDNTPGCTKEACAFRDLTPEIQALDAVVLGISPDKAEAHAKFVSDFSLPFPLLCDPQMEVMKKYDAYGEKVSYGKTTIGVIRSTVWIDSEGKVKKHWRKVSKAADHPAQVLTALQAG